MRWTISLQTARPPHFRPSPFCKQLELLMWFLLSTYFPEATPLPRSIYSFVGLSGVQSQCSGVSTPAPQHCWTQGCRSKAKAGGPDILGTHVKKPLEHLQFLIFHFPVQFSGRKYYTFGCMDHNGLILKIPLVGVHSL